MRRQSGRVDRQRARRLDGVSELEPERLPQPRSAFRDVDVKRDRLPGLENRAGTLRQRVITCLERPGQYLGDRDRRDGEAQAPGSWASKSGLKRGPNFGCPSRRWMMGAASTSTRAFSGRSSKSNGSIRHAAFEASGRCSCPITRDRILRRTSAAAGGRPRHAPRSVPGRQPDGHVW